MSYSTRNGDVITVENLANAVLSANPVNARRAHSYIRKRLNRQSIELLQQIH